VEGNDGRSWSRVLMGIRFWTAVQTERAKNRVYNNPTKAAF
jgi:hypothetical protein